MQNIPPHIVETLEKGYQYSLDLERQARLESAQAQLSPTDMALFSRIISYLRYELPEQLTGDASFVLKRWGQQE